MKMSLREGGERCERPVDRNEGDGRGEEWVEQWRGREGVKSREGRSKRHGKNRRSGPVWHIFIEIVSAWKRKEQKRMKGKGKKGNKWVGKGSVCKGEWGAGGVTMGRKGKEGKGTEGWGHGVTISFPICIKRKVFKAFENIQSGLNVCMLRLQVWVCMCWYMRLCMYACVCWEVCKCV